MGLRMPKVLFLWVNVSDLPMGLSDPGGQYGRAGHDVRVVMSVKVLRTQFNPTERFYKLPYPPPSDTSLGRTQLIRHLRNHGRPFGAAHHEHNFSWFFVVGNNRCVIYTRLALNRAVLVVCHVPPLLISANLLVVA